MAETSSTKNKIFPLQQSARYRWFILATVSVGTFMSTLDGSIVNVALPTISEQFRTGLTTLQWVVTAYLLTISSLLPVFGRLADILGRKRVYSFGFLIFALGSLLCSLSTSVWFLVGTRILQAIGGSMLMSNSAAITTANFPPHQRGRALGLTGTVVSLGSLTGPALGGMLVHFFSWHSIFYINLPIGILGFLAAQMILPPDVHQTQKESFDFIGAFFFVAGMVCVLSALSNGQDWGWGSAPIIGGLIAGVLLLGLFFYTENKVAKPMIDLSLFRIRALLIGNITGLLCFTAMFGNTMLMPFYLQSVLSYSPAQVGLLMMFSPLMMAVAAPISGYASDRLGPSILTTVGLLVMGLGFFYLSVATTVSSTFLQIVPGPLLMGLGSGLFQSPNNSSVMSSVPPPKLSVAGGINALVRNVGMVVGIAYAVSLFAIQQARFLQGIANPSFTQQASAFIRAYHIVMLTSMCIAFFAALISITRRKKQTGSAA